jgi:hypothetical protein
MFPPPQKALSLPDDDADHEHEQETRCAVLELLVALTEVRLGMVKHMEG